MNKIMSSYEKISRYCNLAIAIYKMEEACGNEANIEDIVDDLFNDCYEKLPLNHEEFATLKEAVKNRVKKYSENG